MGGTIPQLKGKYFGQKFQFFPPTETEIFLFLPCFFTPTSDMICITFFKFSTFYMPLYKDCFKWCKAPKIVQCFA